METFTCIQSQAFVFHDMGRNLFPLYGTAWSAFAEVNVIARLSKEIAYM